MATEKKLHNTNQRTIIAHPKKTLRIRKRDAFERAFMEISRLLNCLDLPSSLNSLVFEKFSNFWRSFRPGTRYRNHEILVPFAIYFITKLHKIPINEQDLLKVSNMSLKDFETLRQILQ